MGSIFSINETYELIKFFNELNNYTKITMPDDNLIIFQEGKIYIINKNDPIFAIRGELKIDEKKLPIFSVWCNDKTFILKNREIYDLKKSIIKKNIDDGFYNDTKIILKYKDRELNEKEFIIKHNESKNINNTIDKINNHFIDLSIYKESIEFLYEDYKLYKGPSLYYTTDNKISFNDENELLISAPSKFLIKMGKADSSYFNILKFKDELNYDLRVIIYNVLNKQFNLEQLFISI